MFKYECLVRLLAYVFMAVRYHYGIVMMSAELWGIQQGIQMDLNSLTVMLWSETGGN